MFKPKTCIRCKNKFIPKCGSQKYCRNCSKIAYLEKRRDWAEKHPKLMKQYKDKSYQKYKEERHKYDKYYRMKLRMKILKLLGEQCVKCGFSDWRALQVDHIHGKGAKERKQFKSSKSYYEFLINKIENGSKDYQLLCANCNWIKRYDKKEHN